MKLLLRFFISENGFTGRKYSDRFLILERRKFVRILKSGLMAATVLYRIIPSRAPKGGFDTMMKGRTSFIVAHRLSTIQEADVILVMRDGQIVEQGRHEELLRLDGYYRRLYTRQYEDETTAKILS